MCRAEDYRPDSDEVKLCLTCTLPDCDESSPLCAWAASKWLTKERGRIKSMRFLDRPGNGDKRRAYDRQYYVANRARLLAYRAEWRRRNRGKHG